MKQAILITAYKNIHHLEEIINYFDKDFYFYIHLDKKSRIAGTELRKLSGITNVKLVSRHYKTNWGGMNHLNCTLLLLREALKQKETQYVHLISGHDFPIKSSEEIKNRMKLYNGKQFMEYFELPARVWPKGGMNRLLHYNFYDWINFKGRLGRGITTIQNMQEKIGFSRKLPAGFPKLYGGSTWWTLSAACCNYVLNYIHDHPSFLRRFRFTFCAEEIFFQTLVLNSPFGVDVINDNLRFIDWEVRNGNSPANLDESDFQKLKDSGKLFARRFEYPVSQTLVNKLKAGKQERQ